MVSDIIDIPSFFEQFFVRDDVWTVDLEDTSKAFGLGDFFSDATDVFQHPDPYKRMLRTVLLQILILVWMLSPVDLYLDFNIAKAWLIC